jgi:hypothetical protein
MITGKQLAERTSAFGDKLEIFFNSLVEATAFRVVINDDISFPCISWKEAANLYDHFYVTAEVAA